jgi:hypothetical protein
MSRNVKQRAHDVAQMESEKPYNGSLVEETTGSYGVTVSRGGRPKGSPNKKFNYGHRMPYQPEAIGTFASGSVLGAVLKYDGDYLMVVPNPEFPTVVRMDIETAAFRINVCTEHRIFDSELSAKMNELREKSPNLGI